MKKLSLSRSFEIFQRRDYLKELMSENKKEQKRKAIRVLIQSESVL